MLQGFASAIGSLNVLKNPTMLQTVEDNQSTNFKKEEKRNAAVACAMRRHAMMSRSRG
jgi:hypothetical protein